MSPSEEYRVCSWCGFKASIEAIAEMWPMPECIRPAGGKHIWTHPPEPGMYTQKELAKPLLQVRGPEPQEGPQDVLRDLPADAQERKDTPITSGVLDYFPAALAAIARVSKAGNDQHNPGQPLHWSRGKSSDHADCITRHLIQRGTRDDDGMLHSAKMAWRALALLQEELEAEAGFVPRGVSQAK